jgi:hypothetical protein
LMVSSLAKARSMPSSVCSDVVDVLDRHAVGVQRPFEIGARTILDGAPAGVVLDVEEVLDRLGCLSFGEHLLVIRDERRIDDRRDVALTRRAFEEVLARGRSVGRRVQHLVEVDLHEDALVAGELGVGRQHVDEIPRDVVRLMLGAQARQRVGRAVVADDGDVRIFRHEGIVIGALLAGGIGAAPRHDGQGDRLLRLHGAERQADGQCAAGNNGGRKC